MSSLAIAVTALGLLVVLIMAIVNIIKTKYNEADRRSKYARASSLQSYSSRSGDGSSSYRGRSVFSQKRLSTVDEKQSPRAPPRPTYLTSESVYPPTLFDRCLRYMSGSCPCGRKDGEDNDSSLTNTHAGDPEYGVIVEKLYFYKTPGTVKIQPVNKPFYEMKSKNNAPSITNSKEEKSFQSLHNSKLSELSVSSYYYSEIPNRKPLSISKMLSWSNRTGDFNDDTSPSTDKLSIVSQKPQICIRNNIGIDRVSLPDKEVEDVKLPEDPQDINLPIVLLYDASSTFSKPKSKTTWTTSSHEVDQSHESVSYYDMIPTLTRTKTGLSQVNENECEGRAVDVRKHDEEQEKSDDKSRSPHGRSRKVKTCRSSKPSSNKPPTLSSPIPIQSYMTESLRQKQLPPASPDSDDKKIDNTASTSFEDRFTVPVTTDSDIIPVLINNDMIETRMLHGDSQVLINPQPYVARTHQNNEMEFHRTALVDPSPPSHSKTHSILKNKKLRIKPNSGEKNETRETIPVSEHRSDAKSKCPPNIKDYTRNQHTSRPGERYQTVQTVLSPSSSSFYAIIPDESQPRHNVADENTHCFHTKHIIFENSLFNVRTSNESRGITNDDNRITVEVLRPMLKNEGNIKKVCSHKASCPAPMPRHVSLQNSIDDTERKELDIRSTKTRVIIEDLDVRLSDSSSSSEDIAAGVDFENTEGINPENESEKSSSDDKIGERQSDEMADNLPIVSVQEIDDATVNVAPSSLTAKSGATLRWQIVLRHATIDRLMLKQAPSSMHATSSSDENDRQSDDDDK